METAILIISHGSKSAKTKEEVSVLTDKLKSKFNTYYLDFAFLEIETPSIPDGLDKCIAQGAKKIIIALNFLNSGKHVDKDIPEIVAQVEKRTPHVEFLITCPIGQHEGIVHLFADLIESI